MRKSDSQSIMKKYIRRYGLEHVFPDSILSKLELHYYNSKEYISIANEPIQYFSLCLEGTMKVIPSSGEGKLVLLDYLKPMSVIGDIEFFGGCDTLHCVRAVTPSVTLVIPKHIFMNEMMENVYFLQFMCKTFSEKLQSSSKNYSRSLLYPVKTRLYFYVSQLSDELQSDTVPIKMVETAQYLGISERHLRRILNECEEEGILKQVARQLIITDNVKLKKIVSSLM